MTKLEDKLTASIRKPVAQKKTAKPQTSKNTASLKPKERASAAVKKKQVKQQQASPAMNQSQRIWPD